MPRPSSSTPGSAKQALVLWVAYALLFLAAGGLGAGATALLYELIFQDQFSDVLYAVMFGSFGFMAYQLAHRLVEQRRP